MDNLLVFLKDIVSIQEDYNNLFCWKKLSKRALCDLCIPFRDKYGLTDVQTLQLARNEMSLADIIKIMEEKQNDQ